jgi:hypothetical protein
MDRPMALVDDGCGCVAPGRTRNGFGWIAVLGAIALAAVRRRRVMIRPWRR